jgi:hypothetical protein
LTRTPHSSIAPHTSLPRFDVLTLSLVAAPFPKVAEAAELIEAYCSSAPWATTHSFTSCMRMDKGIMALTGPGDPTGGEGYLYGCGGGGPD